MGSLGEVLRKQRKKKGYTQAMLAEKMNIGDKTISKWETGRSVPDVATAKQLAHILNLSLAELVGGETVVNGNGAGNMARCCWYVCPVCGNVLCAQGACVISCCGLALTPLKAKECDEEHRIQMQEIDGEWYVLLEHPMTKEHYISFLALVNGDRVQWVKLYPEQNAECRFGMRGAGVIYAYCNQHGLFRVRVEKMHRANKNKIQF